MKSKFILTSFVAILLLFTGCGDDGGGGEGVDPELNPEITSVSPQEGTPGTEVTISGSDFSSTASENTVTFGGVEAEVTDASSSKLVTVVPDGAESGAVKVTVDGNTATGPSFTVLEGSKLAITAVEPDSAAIGTAVTIRGMDFSATADENTVTFNGTPATVTAAAEDSLVTEVPEGATSGPIEVTVGGETVSFDGFVVLEEGDNPPPEASSIAATIQNDPELSTLAGLLDGTELQATLEGEGPYTILAPTDDVLATMPNFNATQLEDILSYHVIAEDRASADFQNGDAIVTLYGDSIFVVNDKINHKASITSDDIEASNGTILKIDNLLYPDAYTNVFTITYKRPITNKFACTCVSGEDRTDLGQILRDVSNTFTVFVPSDDAFANRETSVDDLSDAELQGLMDYHVIVGEALTSNELTDGQILTTRNGAELTVSVAADGSISLNNGAGGAGANVIIKDLEGRNGVVYIIDNVLEVPSSGS